jgi:hypothetical protein
VTQVYQASQIKKLYQSGERRRATASEMEQRAAFLIDYAEQHGPVTVRQLYYQAEVRRITGINKTDSGYDKIQHQVLKLRRKGRLSYSDIADATRWMRKPSSYDSVEDALAETARTYRKSLWRDNDARVEIWCEKDALAGVLYQVTSNYDVALMVARGFSSETFCFEAVEQYDEDKITHVYYLGDFDRAGRDAANTLKEKLQRFASEKGIKVMFKWIAVTPAQVKKYRLPTREPKRETKADQNWEYDYACELDAMEPDTMRDLVETAINRHLPQDQLAVLKVAEESEREFFKAFIRRKRR